MERRRVKRYSLFCPVEYQSDNENIKSFSTALNISDGGALIPTANSYEIGANLRIKVPLKDKTFDMNSEIVHVHNRTVNGPYQVGIKFVERSYEFVRRFYDEIEEIVLYKDILSEEQGKIISLAEASTEWYAKQA